MYVFKNALKSITRSKGRNILIGLIVVIIAVASCIALSINNSATEIAKAQTENAEVTATLSINRQQLMEDARSSGGDMKNSMTDLPSLTIDEVEEYATSSYVKSYYYTLSGTVDASITAYTTVSDDSSSTTTEDSTTSDDSGNTMTPPDGQGGDRGGSRFSRGDFTITGYNASSAMADFIAGTSKITEGTIFDDNTAENECIISSELALLNDLSVGDTFSIVNPSNEEDTAAFTIVGIYENSEAGSISNSGFMTDTSNDPANEIITSYTALQNIVTASESLESNTVTAEDDADTSEDESATTYSTAMSMQFTPTFTLVDADSEDAFAADLTSMGLSEYYSVQTNSDSITAALEPVQNLSSFASVFLLLVLIIGGIILIIINMINIRERKYEVGVLRAIGMKKGKLALQFITELFIVTLAAIVVGAVIGSFLSVPTANKLLSSQISSLETQQQQVDTNFGRPGSNSSSSDSSSGNMPSGGGGMFSGGNMGGMFGMSSQENVSYVSQINAVINGTVLLEILGIGVLLTLISSCVAIIYISRYQPLKILSERS